MSSYATTMQSHDDLAALFSRNLTFNPEVQSQVQSPKPEAELKQTPDPAPTNAAPTPAPIIYSITQHYTHSAHIARQPQSQNVPIQRPSSEPPQTEQLTPEIVLSQHGVDPSVLSPSQIQLFRISEEPQQLRLIEIWRAAPPTSRTENPSLAWTSTTLEQEEQLAKLRYERLEAEKQQQQQNAVMSLDGTPVQSDDSRWLANSISHQVEPYMMSGYEEMMRREYEREQVDAPPAATTLIVVPSSAAVTSQPPTPSTRASAMTGPGSRRFRCRCKWRISTAPSSIMVARQVTWRPWKFCKRTLCAHQIHFSA
ncbi:uncharacterized protein LY79DRAFT_240959 [Colletotrichum navitas]|uniref:Uncharacterized protein n=1 Tax=Colletotrichum navitas TaxID=681940 RepID=A0AAD8V280_9PEZI|nr:uncharacterized protein LY79DRAFT_240959 [Colletotrichum navitas]KAK1586146.1 hypothetical protein LY79DRAFT_240959 [Colletotrichum navitas]